MLVGGQARTQPFSRGGGGGLHGGVGQTGMLLALAHSPPRGGLGACYFRKIWKFRLFEGDSEAF